MVFEDTIKTELRVEDKNTKSTLDGINKAYDRLSEGVIDLTKLTVAQGDAFEKATKSGKRMAEAYAIATKVITQDTAALNKWNVASTEAAQHEKTLTTLSKVSTNAKLSEANATSRLRSQQEADITTLKKLNAARNAQIALGTSMASDIDRRRKMTLLHSQALKENTKRIAEVNKRIKNQHGFFQRANAQLFRYRMAYISLAIGIMLVKRALEATWEGLKTGAMINEQMVSLERLAVGYNTNATAIVADLERVSRSTLTTAAMVQSANKAMVMGIAPDTLTTLMKIATAAARATGDSVDKMFADITLGTARSSKKILDNIGIIVDWRSAYTRHAAAIGVTVNMLNEEEKMVARVNAIKEAGTAIVEKLDTGLLTQRERLDRVAASVTNWGNTLKQAFADLVFLAGSGSPIELAERRLASFHEELARIKDTPGLTGETFIVWQETASGSLEAVKLSLDDYIVHLNKSITEQRDIVTKGATSYIEFGKRISNILAKSQVAEDKLLKSDKLTKARADYDALTKTLQKLEQEFARLATTDVDPKLLNNWLKNIAKIKQSQENILIAITEKEQKALDKRLSNINKFTSKAIQEIEKAEASMTKIIKGEHAARLLSLERSEDAKIAKIRETLAKELAAEEEGSEASKKLRAAAAEAESKVFESSEINKVILSLDEYKDSIKDVADILENQLVIAKVNLNTVTKSEDSSVISLTQAYRTYGAELIRTNQINQSYLTNRLNMLEQAGASQKALLGVQMAIADQELSSLQERLSAWQTYYDTLEKRMNTHIKAAERHAETLIGLERQKADMSTNFDKYVWSVRRDGLTQQEQLAGDYSMLNQSIQRADAATGEERVRLFAETIEEQKSLINNWKNVMVDRSKTSLMGFNNEPILSIGSALEDLYYLVERYNSSVDGVIKTTKELQDRETRMAEAAKKELPYIETIIEGIKREMAALGDKYEEFLRATQDGIDVNIDISDALNSFNTVEDRYFAMKRNIENNPITQVIFTKTQPVPYAEGGIMPGHFTPLANGGLINRPTYGLVGEAGPEAVIPLKNGAVPVRLEGKDGSSKTDNRQYHAHFSAPMPRSKRFEVERDMNKFFNRMNESDARLSN